MFMEDLPLIILLIDDKAERAGLVAAGLEKASLTHIPSAAPEFLAKAVNKLQPEVIIMNCDRPDKSQIENLKLATRDNPKPIVMFVEGGHSALAKDAVRAGISAYIVDGLQPARVQPVIDIAIERFNMFHDLNRKLEKTQADLDARKLIERAKGILMETRGVSEAQAFKAMRDLAMKESVTLKQVSENIISVSKLLKDGA